MSRMPFLKNWMFDGVSQAGLPACIFFNKTATHDKWVAVIILFFLHGDTVFSHMNHKLVQ